MGSDNLSRRGLLKVMAGGAVIAASGGLIAACSTDSGPQGELKAKRGGNLRVGLTGGGAGETLDPFKLFLTPDIVRTSLLYSNLGERDASFELKGLLAESVEMADSKGVEWDIRLREGLEFHNGKTVTAEDLIWSAQHLMDPKTTAVGATFVPWIDPKAIKKLDERTARFTLTRPVSIFNEEIFNFATTVVPADFDPAKPVGAGAFKFESFTPGDRSVFTRFDNYSGKVPYVDQVEVISFKDSTALVNALLAGDIDIASSVGSSNARVVEDGGLRTVTTPGITSTPLTMAVDTAPFEDERVRQAFRLIADRPQIVKQVSAGHGEVANDLYSPVDPAYRSDLPQRKQDLAEARKLLAAAGQENITIELATTAGQSETCEVFAQQAKDAGVTVKVVNTDADTFYSKYYNQAAFSSETTLNQSYMANTRLFQLPDSISNQTHWDDKEFNALYDDALTTIDSAKRADILKEMQQIQYDRGAMIIPAAVDCIDATAANVGGLAANKKWSSSLNNNHLENVFIS